MRFSSGPPSEVRVDLTSLIDVVFLLLLFFMLTTTFDRTSKAIDYQLPEAESGGADPQSDAMSLIIDREGRVFHGEKALSDEQLEILFQSWEERDGAAGQTVLIRADLEAQHGRVISLMDRLRKHRILNVSIGVQPPQRP